MMTGGSPMTQEACLVHLRSCPLQVDTPIREPWSYQHATPWEQARQTWDLAYTNAAYEYVSNEKILRTIYSHIHGHVCIYVYTWEIQNM